MKSIKDFLSVLIAAIWISLSELVRNEVLVKSFWVKHYENLGLNFLSEPINGLIRVAWSLIFAIVIFIIAKKFTLIQTTTLSWFFGFVMMWLVICNLNVLPYGILVYTIPLSILETFVAAFIIKKISIKNEVA